jgi:succinate dehydrogenase/fumarate reductase flavoprotein subunit
MSHCFPGKKEAIGMAHQRLVVIGGNGAGMSAAAQARRQNPDLGIAVFERGQHVSYSA